MSHRSISNTLPTATWALIELVKDPALFQAVRVEVLTAYVTDPGKRFQVLSYSTKLTTSGQKLALAL
jgi:hypothetical protein